MGHIANHSKTTRIIPIKNNLCRAIPITSILSSNSWKDKRCFILAGGPSLENFDFNLIANELTIGVNKAFIKFPTKMSYSMDLRFYDMVTGVNRKSFESVKLHNQWLQYKGIKVFLKSRGAKYNSDVYVVEKLPKKTISFDLEKGIWGGNNSAFGAMMLCIALGCKEILFLGLDMKIDIQGQKTHWHSGYSNQNMDSFPKKLKSFADCFEDMAPDILDLGINVVNLNQNSNLKCFPKNSLENFLKNS